MPSRTRAREQALQVLYFMDIGEVSTSDALGLFQSHFKNLAGDFPYARHLVESVSHQKDQLDQLIEKTSENWKISRMSRIDRNILRMGTYELISGSDVPSTVAIDEAIELAKKYGDANSGGFVNGILDRIRKDHQAP